jgi:2-polyprenyl-3-methyl-5-hydroxy-6-metoxy-1,4-benzoquinol methylase
MGKPRSLARRAFKLFYIAYYKLLFGRRFPGAGRAESWVRAWEQETGRGDAPASKETWEEQYQKGGWEFMRRLDELPRYSVLAGYLRHLKPGGSVLDVGSGEGILRDEMRVHGYARWVGVDISETAVAKARETADDRAIFLAANAEEYQPDGRFDAVVFNECVYYFENPIGTVERYRGFLEPGGVILVSMFRSRRADVIRDRLKAILPLREEVELRHRKGTWMVSVFASEGASSRC